MAIIAAFWLACAFLGAVIGGAKESPALGFVLGLLFGPLGMIAAFALDGRRECPRCGIRVTERQGTCPGCGGEVPAITKRDPEAEVSYAERLRRRKDVPPRS